MRGRAATAAALGAVLGLLPALASPAVGAPGGAASDRAVAGGALGAEDPAGTIGFYAIGGRTGRVVAVTAGHVTGDRGSTIESAGASLTTAMKSEAADVSALEVSARPAGTLAVNDGTSVRRVIGSLPLAWVGGARVCAAGSTSAEACGRLVRYGPRGGVASLAGAFVTGSSGGPVYVQLPGETGVRLLGILTRSDLAAHSTVAFVPVDVALREIGAALGEPFGVAVAEPIRPSLQP